MTFGLTESLLLRDRPSGAVIREFSMPEELTVSTRAVTELTPRIRLYEFIPAEEGAILPSFEAGSHVTLCLPSGLKRQYSLCNDPAERNRYVVAIQREDMGRGGSVEAHGKIGAGTSLVIEGPRNLFPLDPDAERSLFIAGGIGITPILSMIRQLQREGRDFHLLYLARSAEEAAFLDVLSSPEFSGRVTVHYDGGDPARLFDLRSWLRNPSEGSHLYCCGPEPLMKAVGAAASHWPEGSVHFEHFTNEAAGPAEGDQPFTVTLARSGVSFEVPAGRSILSVLLENGFDVDFSCEEGTCGTCITRLVEGEADHRDTVLTEGERDGSIVICCSRARTPSITIDL